MGLNHSSKRLLKNCNTLSKQYRASVSIGCFTKGILVPIINMYKAFKHIHRPGVR